MAGYQNKKGYGGADVDLILYDHQQKATPLEFEYTLLVPNWDGLTSVEGIHNGLNFKEDFPYSKFSYIGTVLTFNFQLQQQIQAPILSVSRSQAGDSIGDGVAIPSYIFTVMFLAHDTRSPESQRKYHMYLMEIYYEPEDPTVNTIKIRVMDDSNN